MKLLIVFFQAHSDFRIAELNALAQLFNIEISYDSHDAALVDCPFLIVDFKSAEDAISLASRAILIREIIDPWASATSYNGVCDILKAKVIHPNNASFKIIVSAYNKSLDKQAQLDLINNFSFLGKTLTGVVSLDNPDVIYCYHEDWGATPMKQSTAPQMCYFGVLITKGKRNLIDMYNLKKRSYLGITSMDAELSLLMANQGLVKSGSFVYDPFVGTGSFLITCSHFDAFTMGSDIDGRQIRGKSKHTTVQKIALQPKAPCVSKSDMNEEKVKERAMNCIDSNVQQYCMQGRVIDNLVFDSAHHPFRQVEWFDAIITDPPYGIRAGAKCIGRLPNANPAPIDESPIIKANGEMRYPQTIPYELENILLDLLNFSAKHLVVGGRLVYWFPTIPQDYSDKDLPVHPRLKLIANSEQNFGKWARRLVTMEKIGHVTSLMEATSLTDRPAHSYFRDVFFNKDGRI